MEAWLVHLCTSKRSPPFYTLQLLRVHSKTVLQHQGVGWNDVYVLGLSRIQGRSHKCLALGYWLEWWCPGVSSLLI